MVKDSLSSQEGLAFPHRLGLYLTSLFHFPEFNYQNPREHISQFMAAGEPRSEIKRSKLPLRYLTPDIESLMCNTSWNFGIIVTIWQ